MSIKQGRRPDILLVPDARRLQWGLHHLPGGICAGGCTQGSQPALWAHLWHRVSEVFFRVYCMCSGRPPNCTCNCHCAPAAVQLLSCVTTSKRDVRLSVFNCAGVSHSGFGPKCVRKAPVPSARKGKCRRSPEHTAPLPRCLWFRHHSGPFSSRRILATQPQYRVKGTTHMALHHALPALQCGWEGQTLLYGHVHYPT